MWAINDYHEIRHAIASGDLVALEITWTGTLALPFETLSAASEMPAYFALFLDFRNGRIVALRNYDCYEPW